MILGDMARALKLSVSNCIGGINELFPQTISHDAQLPGVGVIAYSGPYFC